MPDQIEVLRKLQVMDGELFRLRASQRQKPLELEQAQQALAEQHATGQALDARLKTVQLEHKQKEIELATREANTKKLQLQLFQVKTNKEYTAVQHEIDQSKADASLLEEEIITLLEAIDRAAQEHKAQLSRVAQQEALLRNEETRIAQELKDIAEQVATYEQQRQTITPLVEKNTLATCERILANREGLAMVPLVEESCGGCHMVQRPQVINEVHLNTQLVICENCNRILYLEEDTAEQPPRAEHG